MEGYIEIEKHNEIVTEFEAFKSEATQTIAELKFQLAELQRLIHGAKSERYVPDLPPEQLSLFEQEYQKLLEQHTELVAAHERKKVVKKKPARLKLPTHLHIEEEVLEPPVDTSKMVFIGNKYTDTLAYTPADLYIKRLTRRKYAEVPFSDEATSSGQQEMSEQTEQVVAEEQAIPKGPIHIAPMPSRFIDKCIADVSLLVSIIVDKYVDHLPLFRTQRRLKRLSGMEIPRSTMSGWIGQSATKLQVLYEKLQWLVLASTYMQIDETRMEVLPQKTEGLGEEKSKAPPNKTKNSRGRKVKKNKKRKTHRGFLFGYLAMAEQLLFFEYSPTRKADNPMQHLKGYTGTIQTDCYDVYDEIREAYELTHYHCLNHARRNFEKALNNDQQRADHVLGEFQRLYAIEEVARNQNWSSEKIYEVRQEQAQPILEALFDWMEEEYQKVLPASVIAKAIAYMLHRKERMMYYLSDGSLHIDTNPIENAIRPIAVGRRNYLFAGSHDGAQWAAMFYSFFACCRLHEVDPSQWLEDIMRRLPEHPVNQIEQLLPHLWKKNQAKKKTSTKTDSHIQ